MRHGAGVPQNRGDVKVLRTVGLVLVKTGDYHVVGHSDVLFCERGYKLHCGKVRAAHYCVGKSGGYYFVCYCGKIAHPVNAVVNAVFRYGVAPPLHSADEIPLNAVVEAVLRTSDEIYGLCAVVLHNMGCHNIGGRLVVVYRLLNAVNGAVHRHDRAVEFTADAFSQPVPCLGIAYAGGEYDKTVQQVGVYQVVDRALCCVKLLIAGYHHGRKDGNIHVGGKQVFLYHFKRLGEKDVFCFSSYNSYQGALFFHYYPPYMTGDNTHLPRQS